MYWFMAKKPLNEINGDLNIYKDLLPVMVL